MIYYLKLQSIRLQRWLRELGINPLLGLIVSALLFFILSKALFYKTDYAKWIYLLVAMSVVLKCCEQKRTNTLRSIFNSKDFILIRVIENGIVAFPFTVYLLYKKEFGLVLIFFAAIILMAFLRIRQYVIKPIPTPFKRHPFEFIVGFRKTFWLILLAYFLVFKGMQVENYNLSLFGVLLNFIISLFYYQKPETEYFVWIHSYQVKDFLRLKIVTSIVCITMLSFLPLTAILIAFSSKWLITLLVYIVGYVLLATMVLAKYSAFPREMSIPHAILFGLSLMFPPMLMFAIWIFYSKAKKKLEPILR